MRRCDAVLLVPGWKLSEGTLGEIKEAKRLEIPVFKELDECFKSLSDSNFKNNTFGWYGLPEQ
jgi:hypothetical protein